MLNFILKQQYFFLFYFFSFADLCIYPTSCGVGTVPKYCIQNLLLLYSESFCRLEAKNILLRKYVLTVFLAKFCKLMRFRLTFILLPWKSIILMFCHVLTLNLQSWRRKDIIWFTYYRHASCEESIISNQKELFSSTIGISHS